MSIRPLPEHVVTQIKSSATITTLNGAVCGLLQNSLDAGASKINISVDYSRGNCSVEDNGLGIAPSSFWEDGGLGRLHHTSKFPPRCGCHGKRGEFLACLGSLSLLSIASHHRDFRTHNSMTVHNSRIVARNLPAPPEQRVLAFASGTRVVVRDLFGSMPVRVKQRAIEMERAGTSREFDQLIRNITAFLLPWPGEVTVSVQDLYARRTVPLQAPRMVDWSRGCRNTASDMISRTETLLKQASLLGDGDPESWVPVSVTTPGISARGCVSLQPVATKAVQFIALGILPLPNERGSNLFHQEVNRVFEDSSFGVIEGAALDKPGFPVKTGGLTGKELKIKRGIDRWPMFFIQILLDTGTGPVEIDDVLDGSRQHLVAVTDLLQVMAYEFLKKHHFHPKSVNAVEKLKRPKGNSPVASSPPTAPSATPPTYQPGPEAKRRRTRQQYRTQTTLPYHRSSSFEERSASPFASWSRLKSSTPRVPGAKGLSHPRQPLEPPSGGLQPSPSVPEMISKTESPLFGMSGALLRKPFDSVDEASPSPLADLSETQPAPAGTSGMRKTVVWVDPTTKIRSLVDPRTGFAVKPRGSETNRAQVRGISEPREWMYPASGEHSGIFQPTEASIPQVAQASTALGCKHGSSGREPQDTGELTMEPSAGSISATLEGRISKTALRGADVLGQVDQKFILAKATATHLASSKSEAGEAGHILIFIDQHAADERCKVESLLKTYFAADPESSGQLVAQTQSLEKPLRFELSRQDGELFARFKRYFNYWGIAYDIMRDEGEGPIKEVTVEVKMLPPSILERCRLEPRLLIDVLRKQIWKLHGASSGWNAPRVSPDKDWVTRLHDCPEGILDLINSRACRSAVMFNDPLTPKQCSDLVQRLAACAFPFQCAHGRPSMVPLVHLSQNRALGLGNVAARGEAAGDLLATLKSWSRSVVDKR